jgi:hypothetical protein
MHLILLYLLSFISTFASAQTLKTFANPTIPFTAKYPATWENKIKENKRVFFTSPLENAVDSFRQNVNIGITYNKEFGTTLKVKNVLSDIYKELNRSITDFQPIADEKYFKWNGVDACEISYTGFVQDTKAKFIQWFAFSKGRLFTITYSTILGEDAFITQALAIMKSMAIK